MRKKILLISVILVMFGCLFFAFDKHRVKDKVYFSDKKYLILEYPSDIFTYYHYSNKYYEVDEIYPLEHKKWDAVYLNGDVFLANKDVRNAKKYYKKDKNYNWYVAVDDPEYKKLNINLTKEEIKYLYNIENSKHKATISFEEIAMFADLLKISKDNFIQGIITLAKVNNIWYYKTEIMTDDDKEYVIKLPNSINKKINELILKYNYTFIGKGWVRETNYDTEKIWFNLDGTFSYSCACGNPVNDADLCDRYIYDNDTKEINLECSEITKDMVTNIKVLYYDDNVLKLDFNKEIRVFNIDN